MKKAKVGFMERYAIAEELSRKFYAQLGYSVTDEAPPDCMAKSEHAQERACYAMALVALNYFAGGESL